MFNNSVKSALISTRVNEQQNFSYEVFIINHLFSNTVIQDVTLGNFIHSQVYFTKVDAAMCINKSISVRTLNYSSYSRIEGFIFFKILKLIPL